MILPIFCLLVIFSQVSAEEELTENEDSRIGKLLPIFQVVRFPNAVCTGNTRNGTCYTAEECTSKGGTNEGSCASGFGVCCVISLACGGTSSNNNSYIVQSATTTAPATPCLHTICPCSTDICRIRYDFTTMVLASQAVGTISATPPLTANGAQGDCVTDQFSISAPGAIGSPIICGTNTGYHMILDSDGTQCQGVNINVGSSTSTTRSWDIYVTQYTCGQEDEAGPPGCLQYFTGTGTHVLKNFGYPTSNTATAAQSINSQHLSDQNYQVCFRREVGYCYICYFPWQAGIDPTSFGVSISNNAVEKASAGSYCTTDYLIIPQGTTTTIAATTTPGATTNRVCGRFFDVSNAATDNDTICSREYPFRLGVVFDSSEVCTAVTDATTCESFSTGSAKAGGIAGFALNVYQVAC